MVALSKLVLAWVMAGAVPQQGKPSVAILNVKHGAGFTEQDAELLTGTLTASVRSEKRFSRVMAANQVSSVLNLESQRQLMNCTSSDCMAEIAGALGVDFLISCQVGTLGTVWIINASLIRHRNAEVIGSVSQKVDASDRGALATAIPLLVKELLDDGGIPGGQPQQQHHATPRPAEPPAASPTSASFLRPWMACGACTLVPSLMTPVDLVAAVGLFLGSAYVYGIYANKMFATGTLDMTLCGASAGLGVLGVVAGALSLLSAVLSLGGCGSTAVAFGVEPLLRKLGAKAERSVEALPELTEEDGT